MGLQVTWSSLLPQLSQRTVPPILCLYPQEQGREQLGRGGERVKSLSWAFCVMKQERGVCQERSGSKQEKPSVVINGLFSVDFTWISGGNVLERISFRFFPPQIL